MSKYPIQLAQYIQKNELVGATSGLMSGNTGLSIFFYHLAKYTSNIEYEQIADDMLDKVFSNLSASAFPDFENGLAGIGWGIEYLVQNGFAEGNTDEILEEVDNEVFRTLQANKLMSFELTNGLTGYLFYLISRLKNPTNTGSMARRINRGLLILVINQLDDIVTKQFSSVTKEMHFDLFWRFPVMFYGLVEAFDLDIYSEKIKCMVNQWMLNLETYLPSMHINRLFMATVLTLMNVRVPDKRLEKQIHILLFATDFGVLKTEADFRHMNVRFGWPGVAWVLSRALQIIPETYPNYQLIKVSYREIIQNYEPTLNGLQMSVVSVNPKQSGISEGCAGIGLMELLWPDIFLGNINKN